ncbi:MAG: hypothetical protein R2744_08735 [Bacteroidales bacterium]
MRDEDIPAGVSVFDYISSSSIAGYLLDTGCASINKMNSDFGTWIAHGEKLTVHRDKW